MFGTLEVFFSVGFITRFITKCYAIVEALENRGQKNVRPQACYQITQIGENEPSGLEYCGCVYISWFECAGEFSQALECNGLCKGTLKMFLGMNVACSSYQSSQIIPRLDLLVRRIQGPFPKDRLHVAILFRRLIHFTNIDAGSFLSLSQNIPRYN